MSVLNLTKSNFVQEINSSDKPVLIDFWASWCNPCRMVSPLVDEIAEENPEIKVCKVNIDDEPELAQQYGVMSIPTLIIVKNGQIVNRSTGARPKKAILDLING